MTWKLSRFASSNVNSFQSTRLQYQIVLRKTIFRENLTFLNLSIFCQEKITRPGNCFRKCQDRCEKELRKTGKIKSSGSPKNRNSSTNQYQLKASQKECEFLRNYQKQFISTLRKKFARLCLKLTSGIFAKNCQVLSSKNRQKFENIEPCDARYLKVFTSSSKTTPSKAALGGKGPEPWSYVLLHCISLQEQLKTFGKWNSENLKKIEKVAILAYFRTLKNFLRKAFETAKKIQT